MTRAAKPSSPAPSAHAELPFEEALQKLETIVESMEADELPLETLLARYEEGTRLAKVCQDRLTDAEAKIEHLEKTAAGELATKPLRAPDIDTE